MQQVVFFFLINLGSSGEGGFAFAATSTHTLGPKSLCKPDISSSLQAILYG